MTRSTFPTTVDTFNELYDLPPNLVASAKRYQELKIKPTLSAAEQAELNNLSTTLGDFIISPETFNKFQDALIAMQVFIKDEVDGYIDGKQAEWDTYVEAFTYKGVYSGTATYKYQNMVTSNGDLYLAIKDVPTGTAVSNITYWQKISAKGEKGDVGLQAYYKGNYSATVVYEIGDAVTYSGQIYFCILTTTAGTAPTNATYWKLWDKTYVGATAPTTAQQGLLWIEVLD